MVALNRTQSNLLQQEDVGGLDAIISRPLNPYAVHSGIARNLAFNRAQFGFREQRLPECLCNEDLQLRARNQVIIQGIIVFGRPGSVAFPPFYQRGLARTIDL